MTTFERKHRTSCWSETAGAPHVHDDLAARSEKIGQCRAQPLQGRQDFGFRHCRKAQMEGVGRLDLDIVIGDVPSADRPLRGAPLDLPGRIAQGSLHVQRGLTAVNEGLLAKCPGLVRRHHQICATTGGRQDLGKRAEETSTSPAGSRPQTATSFAPGSRRQASKWNWLK